MISGALFVPKPQRARIALEALAVADNAVPTDDGAEEDDSVGLPEDPSEMFRIMTGHTVDDWQRTYLTRTDSQPCTRQRNLLLTARQVGKSTVVSVRCARRMLKWRHQEIVTVSKTDTQAKLLTRKIARGMARWVPRPTWPTDNVHEIELPNGNTIHTLPGGNPEGIRGFSPTLLVLDEAAFVPEELIAALSPMVARTKGDWDMLSSANGPAGTFWESVEGEQAKDWEHIIVTADQCSAYDEQFLASETRRLGEQRYLREYFCKFIAPEGAYFSMQSIEALLEGDRWAGSKSANGHRPPLDEEWDLDDLDEALDPTRHADKKLDKARFFD